MGLESSDSAEPNVFWAACHELMGFFELLP